ncbi:MAG: O-antigen ligase family protein [Jejuia sp.]
MKLSNYYKLIFFHLVLGIVVYAFKLAAILFFISTTLFWFYKIITASSKLKAYNVLMACAYLVGAEVFLRMNDGTFFYESIKYLVIIYMILGILTSPINNKGLIYSLFIILLIPSIYVAISTIGFETNIRKAIAFNLSGPVCLGICAIYCYGKIFSLRQVKTILLCLMLPLLSMTVYLFLYTPDLEKVITGTQSNFATSGGFGPNQVATVLGVGMFVMATRFYMSKSRTIFKVVDLLILSFISFRAIVTFSRGGVIAAVIMIVCFIALYYRKVNVRHKRRLIFSSVIFIGIGIFIWIFSAIQTGGFIEKRYANEDAAGRKKEDLSTGRKDLIVFELNEFLDNPFLGIGVGKIKERRLSETGHLAASHNEMSRIVAEHGLFGIFAFLILLSIPLVIRASDRSNIFFYSFYLFWLLTINHSAMRIAAPAFIYALCLLKIDYSVKKVTRKELIKPRKLSLTKA